MKLRLIEQGCSYSVLRVEGSLYLYLCACSSSLPLALAWCCHFHVRHLQDSICLCNETALKLRLIEQACTRCFAMRGGVNVRARLCFWHLDGECSPP